MVKYTIIPVRPYSENRFCTFEPMTNSPYITITCLPSHRKIQAPKGSNVFDILKKEGMRIAYSCSGEGICAQCVLTISPAENVTPQSKIERERKKPIGSSPTCASLVCAVHKEILQCRPAIGRMVTVAKSTFRSFSSSISRCFQSVDTSTTSFPLLPRHDLPENHPTSCEVDLSSSEYSRSINDSATQTSSASWLANETPDSNNICKLLIFNHIFYFRFDKT